MRVFCPVHKKSFTTPRRNPIRCENKNHLLGKLDFEGRAEEALEDRWQYCCNCEHFWPSHLADEQCPVCNRQISTRYLCDRCYTFSLESPTPASVKNFTITPEGIPRPSCPGCLQEIVTGVVLHEHQCSDLGETFNTALRSCPMCKEPIGEAPSFPCRAVECLSKGKSNTQLTLDYENDLLVEAKDGEFVLIPRGGAANEPIIVPKLTDFTNKQEFYEYYQDYYHCENPSAGDVTIIHPAVVDHVEGGWKLREAGLLEVRKESLAERVEVPEPDLVAGEDPSLATKRVKSKCISCGAVIDPQHLSEWGFCWNCGEPLASGKDSSRELADEDTLVPSQDKQTRAAHPATSSSRLSILEPAFPEPDSSSGKLKAGRLALFGLIGLVVIGSMVWIVLRSRSQAGSVNALNGQETEAAAQSSATASTSAQTATTRPEDDEILSIRERVDGVRSAPPSERLQIIEELQAAELKFSADYRFPYERAKLSIKGVVAHDEAFAALLVAAEKALTSGKAKEMLTELMIDKETYFRKTSRGHEEWNLLLDALKNEDRRILRDLTTRIEKKTQH